MPHTLSKTIEIPSSVAAQIHLTDIPCAPLKLLLVAESEREPGCDVVDMPVMRARAMTGFNCKTFFESIGRLAPFRAQWQAESDDTASDDLRRIDPFAEKPRAYWHGDDQRLLIRFGPDWVSAARGAPVSLPLDELRAYRTRAALLIRLRAGAAVQSKPQARLRVRTRDLALLSGCGGSVTPGVHWASYIDKGIDEVRAKSSTISLVTVEVSSTTAGYMRFLSLGIRRLDVRHVGRKTKAA